MPTPTISINTRPTRLVKVHRVDAAWIIWLFTTQNQPQQQHTYLVLHDNGRIERIIETGTGTIDVFVVEEGIE